MSFQIVHDKEKIKNEIQFYNSKIYHTETFCTPDLNVLLFEI